MTTSHCTAWHGTDAPGCPCTLSPGHLGGHVCAAGFYWDDKQTCPQPPDLENRVRRILDTWYWRHRFYIDAANDAAVLDSIAADICRTIEARESGELATPSAQPNQQPLAMALPGLYQGSCSMCGVTFTADRDEVKLWLASHRCKGVAA